MNLRKNLLKVFSANFIQTITGIIVGFIVPSILTIEGYADLKTYALYMSYVGVLHFGFIDGLYLKYGGKDSKDIDYSELKSEHLFIIIMQVFVTIAFLIFSFLMKDMISFLIAISILPSNLVSFHKQFYQATGNFNIYSKIVNIYSVIYIILNIVLVFLLKTTTFEIYCLVTFSCNFIVLIVSELIFLKSINGIKCTERVFDKKRFKTMKIGFILMIGNLIAILLFALDKWFVKIFFTVEDFSYYSFAVSMFNIIIVFLNSICITFYNVFAKDENKNNIIKIKEKLLVIGSISSISYFVLAEFVELFLPKYGKALLVISYTFASFPYLFIIKAVFINLYKSQKKEKKYTSIVILILVLSCFLNCIFIFIYNNINSIAIATLLTFIIWYFLCYLDFRYLKSNIREIIFLIFITGGFIISSHFSNNYLGFVIYFIILIVGITVILKFKLRNLINVKKLKAE